MHQSRSHLALNKATAMMRWFWCGVWSGFGGLAGALDFDSLIENWIHGIFRRLDDLLTQYRAGMLPAPREPMPARKDAGDGARVQRVLSLAETADLLEAAPLLARGLRPVAVPMLEPVETAPVLRARRGVTWALCCHHADAMRPGEARIRGFFKKWALDGTTLLVLIVPDCD